MDEPSWVLDMLAEDACGGYQGDAPGLWNSGTNGYLYIAKIVCNNNYKEAIVLRCGNQWFSEGLVMIIEKQMIKPIAESKCMIYILQNCLLLENWQKVFLMKDKYKVGVLNLHKNK